MNMDAKNILKTGATAALVAASLFAAPSAGTAEDRPLFIAVGAVARPPIGWVEFCVEYDPECRTKP